MPRALDATRDDNCYYIAKYPLVSIFARGAYQSSTRNHLALLNVTPVQSKRRVVMRLTCLIVITA
jgi:hypothetical protein